MQIQEEGSIFTNLAPSPHLYLPQLISLIFFLMMIKNKFKIETTLAGTRKMLFLFFYTRLKLHFRKRKWQCSDEKLHSKFLQQFENYLWSPQCKHNLLSESEQDFFFKKKNNTKVAIYFNLSSKLWGSSEEYSVVAMDNS